MWMLEHLTFFQSPSYKSNCIGKEKKLSSVELVVCPSSFLFRLGALDTSYSSTYICTAPSGLGFQACFQNILVTSCDDSFLFLSLSLHTIFPLLSLFYL